MTVSTFYGDTSDASIQSYSFTYSVAANGTGTFNVPSGIETLNSNQWLPVGQDNSDGTGGALGAIGVDLAFLAWDTSSIPDGDAVTAVTPDTYSSGNVPGTHFTLKMFVYDWGASVTAADWRTPAQLSALTEFATLATLGNTSVGHKTWTPDAAAPTAINKTGFTRVVVASDKTESATAPTTEDLYLFIAADFAGTGGDPYIEVVHTSPAPVAAFFATDTSPDVGEVITLFNTSVNDVSWAWSFTGGGAVTYHALTSATSENPQVSFSAGGLVTVELQAFNDDGVMDSEIKTDYITVTAPPSRPRTTLLGRVARMRAVR